MFNEETQEYIFDSKITVAKNTSILDELDYDTLQDYVKNETMFFRADLDFAMSYGGFLTHEFLTQLQQYPGWSGDNVIIDSRVHMLMPNWWPSIPGNHLDAVPRELNSKQPNHKNPSIQPEHCMMLVGDCSLTEFALGSVKLPEIKENEVYYREWHPLVEQQIKDGSLSTYTAKPHELIFFDWQAWHKAVKATKRGWRLFIRATKNSPSKVMNEIRRNAQVYLQEPYEGW